MLYNFIYFNMIIIIWRVLKGIILIFILIGFIYEVDFFDYWVFYWKKRVEGEKYMIRLLEGNYRKMEKIIWILFIFDKWMIKKEFVKWIGSLEFIFVRYIEEIKICWGMDIMI